jgi:hypothetical protein
MKLHVNEKVFDIDAESNVYNDYVNSMENDNMDLSEHFSEESVKMLRDITEGKMLEKVIQEEIYRLIDFLNLNYLLFNHNIQENPSVTNKRIKEYYEIMKSPKNFLKNLLGNLGQYAIKLLNYKKLQTFINVCDKAVEIGNLECLKYAHENGCPWNEKTCRCAAMNGYLDCLKYAFENGCPWNKDTCSCAAMNGHLECLKYAHENGCPWNDYTCTEAARNGHLECLKYAHENGCPWNKFTCKVAAEHRQLECLKYAHENGCPWNMWTCAFAALNGHLDCLKYACDNNCPGSSKYL